MATGFRLKNLLRVNQFFRFGDYLQPIKSKITKTLELKFQL
jgi:hypothetical protein